MNGDYISKECKDCIMQEHCVDCSVKENKRIKELEEQLKNSISKDRIRKYKQMLENKLNEYKTTLDNKKYICTTNLSKEEKQLIDNIIVQISTLEELLKEE